MTAEPEPRQRLVDRTLRQTAARGSYVQTLGIAARRDLAFRQRVSGPHEATFADTSLSELALSSGACIPVFAGMWLGSKIRVQIDEIAFRRLVLATYLATGASFLLKAAW